MAIPNEDLHTFDLHILTLEQAARAMDVEEEMIQYWLASGELPSLGCADVTRYYLRYRQKWRDLYEEDSVRQEEE